MGQRNPAPVESGGKHPIFQRGSTNPLVVDFETTLRTLGLQSYMVQQKKNSSDESLKTMLLGGWWFQPFEKYEFVSWDDGKS